MNSSIRSAKSSVAFRCRFSIVVGKPVPPEALDGEPGEVTARLQQHTVEALRADRNAVFPVLATAG